MKNALRVIVLSVVLLPMLGSSLAFSRTLNVGQGQEFSKPSEAAKKARRGDVILIDAGTYENDVTKWRADGLLIKGINGRARLKSSRVAGGKAIWVVRGDNITIENIEFSGARTRDKNGAGIRLIGANLTVRNCYFHHNENGILTGGKRDSDILIESSEFGYNGHGDGYSHNLYVGKVRSLTLRNNYFHHAHVGHHIKSRAKSNIILYNRVTDEETGRSSYLVDLPNGGRAYLVGNILQQGTSPENNTLVSFATARSLYKKSEFYAVNNTLVNDYSKGRFFQIGASVEQVGIFNNVLSGAGRFIGDRPVTDTNILVDDSSFRVPDRYDYRLTEASKAIDSGASPHTVNGFDLKPAFEYLHKSRIVPRPQVGIIDMGAYEYRGPDSNNVELPAHGSSSADDGMPGTSRQVQAGIR